MYIIFFLFSNINKYNNLFLIMSLKNDIEILKINNFNYIDNYIHMVIIFNLIFYIILYNQNNQYYIVKNIN